MLWEKDGGIWSIPIWVVVVMRTFFASDLPNSNMQVVFPPAPTNAMDSGGLSLNASSRFFIR
jgi:hypothetical protein